MNKKILIFLVVATSIAAQSVKKDFIVYSLNRLSSVNAKINSFPKNHLNQFRKKKGLAIIYSLLLPGMGELYAGSFSTGKYFTITDGLLWGTLLGLDIYGNWQKDNYLNFAKAYGGVSLEGKNDNYFANIGLYNSIYDYNREKKLNRNFANVYNEKKDFWRWKNDEQRREYRGMWKLSQYAFNSIQFAIGALIINRIISAIYAAKAVSDYNKKLAKRVSWQVNLNVVRTINNSPLYKLNIFAEF